MAGDKEKIKAVIGIVNNIDEINFVNPTVNPTYTKYLCKVFNVKIDKLFLSGYTHKLDNTLVELVKKYQDVFKIYGFGIHPANYTTYRGRIINWIKPIQK